MSNKLNRRQRRADVKAIKNTVFEQTRDSMERRIMKVHDEQKEYLDHFYVGMWYSIAALALHDIGLSQRTIGRFMERADEIYGEHYHGKISCDDIIDRCAKEADIGIEFDADRDYIMLSRFEKRKRNPGIRLYNNITALDIEEPNKAELEKRLAEAIG